jgi:hypothetical protein
MTTTTKNKKRKITGYPRAFTIETPDGAGEAIKYALDEEWFIAVPTSDFRYYGSAPEAKARIRAFLKDTYSEGVGFGPVARWDPVALRVVDQ